MTNEYSFPFTNCKKFPCYSKIEYPLKIEDASKRQNRINERRSLPGQMYRPRAKKKYRSLKVFQFNTSCSCIMNRLQSLKQTPFNIQHWLSKQTQNDYLAIEYSSSWIRFSLIWSDHLSWVKWRVEFYYRWHILNLY